MAYTIKTYIADTAEVSSADKKLSISLKPDGFSFTIFAGNRHLLHYCDVALDTNGSIATISADIKSLFADKKISTFGFKEAELIAVTELSSWLPEHLYERGRERQYLSLVGNTKSGTTCFSDYSELLKSYVVFTADSTAVSAFKITFPGIRIRCQYSKLVVPEFVQQSDPVMLLNIRHGYCDFVASSGGQLQLSNAYECTSQGDIMYRALNVAKSLGIDNTALTLYLCGDVDKATYDMFIKYFPQVKLYTGHPFTCNNEEFRNIHVYKEVMVF